MSNNFYSSSITFVYNVAIVQSKESHRRFQEMEFETIFKLDKL